MKKRMGGGPWKNKSMLGWGSQNMQGVPVKIMWGKGVGKITYAKRLLTKCGGGRRRNKICEKVEKIKICTWCRGGLTNVSIPPPSLRISNGIAIRACRVQEGKDENFMDSESILTSLLPHGCDKMKMLSCQGVWYDEVYVDKESRGPVYVKSASPTKNQNQWTNDVFLDCSLSKPYMKSKLMMFFRWWVGS